jgi:hypothetical protein
MAPMGKDDHGVSKVIGTLSIPVRNQFVAYFKEEPYMKLLKDIVKVLFIIPVGTVITLFFGHQPVMLANDMMKKQDRGAMEYQHLERI